MTVILLLLLAIVATFHFAFAYLDSTWKMATIKQLKGGIHTRSTLGLLSTNSIKITDILDYDYKNDKKLPWLQKGYKTWLWNDYKINYVDIGGDLSKPPLLLIHGFGASIYHWRYNIPVLAEKYHVYAIDLLGFGLSDKPVIDYTAEVWRDQVLSFIEEIVHKSPHRNTPIPCAVAGNSLGGFAALYAASSDISAQKNLINGCILLNAAGRFRSLSDKSPKKQNSAWLEAITEYIQRLVIAVSFYYTKQPARIEQVLRQVYPVSPDQVDSELVDSIQFPSQHPNAPEVFYRVVAKNGNGPPKFIDDLLLTLKVPLLLLWGNSDPWIRTGAADMIQELYPAATRVDLNAGHCPHDESPAEVNAAIDKFMASIHTRN